MNVCSAFFVCLFGFLTSSSTTRLYRGRAPREERLAILRAATHEIELGDHDFCLSRSHYTDTDPTCRERAATAGIEPGTSSPGVARSTAELPRPPLLSQTSNCSAKQANNCICGVFFSFLSVKSSLSSDGLIFYANLYEKHTLPFQISLSGQTQGLAMAGIH